MHLMHHHVIFKYGDEACHRRDMKQINVIIYSLDLALSNEYLEVIIETLEPIVFDEKVKVLFSKIKYAEQNLNFLIEYLRF